LNTAPPPPPPATAQGRQDACRTFLDQTKQLITLASAFLFAPAAIVTWGKALESAKLSSVMPWFVGAETCFVLSVILGYVTIGTIAGTQNDGTYNVFRVATRGFSIAQFLFYLLGIVIFGMLMFKLYP
jgi:hypothetical protein